MKIKNHTTLVAFSILASVLITGCVDRAEQVEKFDGVTNVREKAGGYIMYDIEKGTVTCYEHTRRSELTCWKNGN
jgi:uncharacterized lipoprotein YehR (DUF1307 family)